MFSAASFRPAVLPGLLGAALLSGCARTADNFTPASSSAGPTAARCPRMPRPPCMATCWTTWA
ncbi:hypothetical protein MSS93_13540 [Deinococcus radiodurans]|nr:hypothetical protein MSS93_13540 [Deinococcus radiodurans]